MGLDRRYYRSAAVRSEDQLFSRRLTGLLKKWMRKDDGVESGDSREWRRPRWRGRRLGVSERVDVDLSNWQKGPLR
jgi:hypothetical protein